MLIRDIVKVYRQILYLAVAPCKRCVDVNDRWWYDRCITGRTSREVRGCKYGYIVKLIKHFQVAPRKRCVDVNTTADLDCIVQLVASRERCVDGKFVKRKSGVDAPLFSNQCCNSHSFIISFTSRTEIFISCAIFSSEYLHFR